MRIKKCQTASTFTENACWKHQFVKRLTFVNQDSLLFCASSGWAGFVYKLMFNWKLISTWKKSAVGAIAVNWLVLSNWLLAKKKWCEMVCSLKILSTAVCNRGCFRAKFALLTPAEVSSWKMGGLSAHMLKTEPLVVAKSLRHSSTNSKTLLLSFSPDWKKGSHRSFKAVLKGVKSAE